MKIVNTGLIAVMLGALSSCFGAQEVEEPILDQNIKMAYFEALTYPRLARAARIQGVVVVRVQISASGQVTSATALSGPKMLIDDSVANAKKWRFETKGKTGILVYIFKLDGLCGSPCSTSTSVTPPNIVNLVSGESIIERDCCSAIR